MLIDIDYRKLKIHTISELITQKGTYSESNEMRFKQVFGNIWIYDMLKNNFYFQCCAWLHFVFDFVLGTCIYNLCLAKLNKKS